MPRNGSGGYSLPTNSWNPAVNAASATPADWQALINDVATAIQGSLAADGQTPLAGNLDAGNNKIIALAAPTANGNALRLQQVLQGADIASATTPSIPLEGGYFLITGTTTITGFGATSYGRTIWVKFDGALTLTNSSTFSMPDAVDITTAQGDVAGFTYDADGWNCVLYRKKNPDYTGNYVAVAGAGGGGSSSSGSWHGGGGGAGGVKPGTFQFVHGTAYAITIGNGGASNTAGQNTVITGVDTAVGGGKGGSNSVGGNGGSGGGGSTNGQAGGAATAGQGNAGGTAQAASAAAGGGGGAGTAGGTNVAGQGLSFAIGATLVTVGAGGQPGNAGSGAGAANTGNGGDGGNASGTNPGYAGGSGKVVIWYRGAQRGTGGTITSSGGYTIHTFTSNGTFTA